MHVSRLHAIGPRALRLLGVAVFVVCLFSWPSLIYAGGGAANGGFGSCCMLDGNCDDNVSQGACDAVGGDFNQGGDCNTDCPQVGACCLDDGTCDDTQLEDGCAAAGGFWQGEGIDCATADCPTACCMQDGTCTFVSETDCTTSGGTSEPGRSCANSLCFGACCLDDGGCFEDSLEECNNSGGTYQGLDTSCADVNCPTACCLPDGTCSFVSETDCTNSGGTPQPNESCDTASCFGACCFEDGFCSDDQLDSCEGSGGTYQGFDTTCADANCPTACCMQDGTCTFVSETDCTNSGGTPQPSESCDSASCFGACCFEDGFCSDDQLDSCEGSGGTYQGLDASCADVNCPTACCLPDGTCSFVSETDCTNSGGTPQPNQDCDSASCIGACCFEDGACSDDQLDFCEGSGGTYQGFDTSCADVNCPTACCLPDGTCSFVSETDCTASSGNSLPDQNCNVAMCFGACCTAASECVNSDTLENCMSTGGTYQGLDVDCDDADCAFACCLPNETCMLIGTDQCIAQDGRPQGDGQTCDDVNCTERPHTGWNHVSTEITLTKNEPAYWSALTGQPKGVAPFTILDPGDLPGRPAMDGTNDRVLRGYVVAWAVDANNEEIRWNHLKGDAVIVNYDDPSAWEYNSWAFPVVADVAHGEQSGDPGTLNLDGSEYALAYDELILDFYASGADPFHSGAQIQTALTLHPVSLDLRQEDDGPITTKAKIDIWNQNETKFNGTERCITCWDCTLLSQYTTAGVPNNFLYTTLQTDKGKARINGIRSDNCDVDYEFNPDFPFGTDPRDVVSTDSPLLGVAVKRIGFTQHFAVANGADTGHATAGFNLIGSGSEAAMLQYDVLGQPPESTLPEPVSALLRRLRRADSGRTGTTEGAAQNGADRVSGTEKGSLLIFSKVEIRWTPQGELYQDTFLDISNDFAEDVRVQMYFINGDAPSN